MSRSWQTSVAQLWWSCWKKLGSDIRIDFYFNRKMSRRFCNYSSHHRAQEMLKTKTNPNRRLAALQLNRNRPHHQHHRLLCTICPLRVTQEPHLILTVKTSLRKMHLWENQLQKPRNLKQSPVLMK